MLILLFRDSEIGVWMSRIWLTHEGNYYRNRLAFSIPDVSQLTLFRSWLKRDIFMFLYSLAYLVDGVVLLLLRLEAFWVSVQIVTYGQKFQL